MIDLNIKSLLELAPECYCVNFECGCRTFIAPPVSPHFRAIEIAAEIGSCICSPEHFEMIGKTTAAASAGLFEPCPDCGQIHADDLEALPASVQAIVDDGLVRRIAAAPGAIAGLEVTEKGIQSIRAGDSRL